MLIRGVFEARFELFIYIWVEVIFYTHVVEDVGLVFQRKCVVSFIMQKLEHKFDASVGVLHVVIEKQRVLGAESLGLNFKG